MDKADRLIISIPLILMLGLIIWLRHDVSRLEQWKATIQEPQMPSMWPLWYQKIGEQILVTQDGTNWTWAKEYCPREFQPHYK